MPAGREVITKQGAAMNTDNSDELVRALERIGTLQELSRKEIDKLHKALWEGGDALLPRLSAMETKLDQQIDSLVAVKDDLRDIVNKSSERRFAYSKIIVAAIVGAVVSAVAVLFSQGG